MPGRHFWAHRPATAQVAAASLHGGGSAGRHTVSPFCRRSSRLRPSSSAPVQGRVFFEEVIRQNLAMGRSDHVSLIFNRRVTKRTPSGFRTRVITHGVTPSLHIDYKKKSYRRVLQGRPRYAHGDQRHVRLRTQTTAEISRAAKREGANKPTDACWASHALATMVPWAWKPCTSCTHPRSWMSSGPALRGSRRYWALACYHGALATPRCAPAWHHSWDIPCSTGRMTYELRSLIERIRRSRRRDHG